MPQASNFDIVIIGAGAAGIPAAVFAAQEGARVLLIEAADVIGGTFHLSSGQMSASGTRVQAAKGIVDTPDLHYADVMRISRGTANPALVRLAVTHAADTLHWLLDNGLEIEPHHPVIHQGHQPYEIPRTYWAPEGGLAVLKVLAPLLDRAVAQRHVEVRTRTRLREIEMNGAGRATGVTVERPDGSVETIGAGDILLATGGYTADPELFARLSKGKPLYGGGHPHNRGEGLLAATNIGAARMGEEQYLPTFAGVRQPSAHGGYTASTETYPQYRMPWELYVDPVGRRFVCEDEESVDARERALLSLPDMRFWAIFDDAILAEAPPFVVDAKADELEERFRSNPAYARADSLEELAKAIGADADELDATVAAFNHGVLTGEPDPMGRLHRPLPIAQPPFYAIEHVGWTVVGFAGLAIDDTMRVLRPDGSAIEGLYAAGEIIGLGQTSGNAFCGGMSVTPAMTFGRLVGQALGRQHARSAAASA